MAQPGMMSPVDALAPAGPTPPPRNWAPVLGGIGVAVFVLLAAAAVLGFFVMDLMRSEQANPSVSEVAGAEGPSVTVPGQSPEAIYDKYLAMADDESIYEIIPETEEGWDYFRAFMYKI